MFKLFVHFAVQETTSIDLLILSEMTENPTTKYVKILATPLINFGHTSVIVLVASNLAVLQNFRVF